MGRRSVERRYELVRDSCVPGAGVAFTQRRVGVVVPVGVSVRKLAVEAAEAAEGHSFDLSVGGAAGGGASKAGEVAGAFGSFGFSLA